MHYDITTLGDETRGKIYEVLVELEDEYLFDLASIIHQCLSECQNPDDALGAIADVLRIIQEIELGRSGRPMLREVNQNER